jgi:hypothetical protein
MHGRSEFFHGRVQLLLVTERFHFYHRFRLRGIQHIVFYSPPTFEAFYPELVNLIRFGMITLPTQERSLMFLDALLRVCARGR